MPSKVKHLKPAEFQRFWGVKPETFEHMVEVVRHHSQQKQKPGRPGKISLSDQVLMTLEYWREYRTYFHIGVSWGVAESTACRIIRFRRKYFKQISNVHTSRKQATKRSRFYHLSGSLLCTRNSY